MKKILVVGQTPPPYGGQAMMTKRLVEATFEDVQIIHVRLSFSENFTEIGKASWKKVLHLCAVVGKIWKYKLQHKDLALYYMPAGPNKVPVIRDLLLLALVRPFFSKTIFHFRAAGVSEFVSKQSRPFRKICKLVYGRPDVSIQLSSLNPADANYFSSKTTYVIPNGLEDGATSVLNVHADKLKAEKDVINILFVGFLREDKGLSWLLKALHRLKEKGVTNFHLYAMGEFNSRQYEQATKTMIEAFQLQHHVSFLGVKVGQEKWKYFSKADFLCFPTFFDCESFGNVLVEAMMFQLPVITSHWRGIPDIVTEDVGFLVPVQNNELLAEKIQLLIENESLRKQMGQKARERFQEKYTLNRYLGDMEQVFQNI